MMTSPQLSICIPTYNRAAMLAEALDAVIGQIPQAGWDKIEVILSDNCSTDRTPDVVKQIREAHPTLRLTYFRQPENKGASANVVQVLNMAVGDYVYLLSDDDVLLPNALRGMLALLQEYPTTTAFCLNTRPFVHDPAEETPLDFPVEADQTILGRDACLRFLGTRITFISLLLFRRDKSSPAGYDSRTDSNMPHSYLYLDVLAAGEAMRVTQQAFLATRDNNTGGYNFFETFVTRFSELMRYAQSLGFSEAAIRQVRNRHLTHFIAPFAATFKLHGSYGRLQPDFRDGAKRLLSEYGLHPFLIFGLLPLMFAPRRLAYGLQAAVRLFKRRPKTFAEAGQAQ